MPRPRPYPLSAEQIQAVATAADVSPRTVRRYLAGVSVLGSTLRRLLAAMRAQGHGELAERLLGDPRTPAGNGTAA